MSIRHADHRYGSMPTTPVPGYGIDHRSHELGSVLEHVRMGIEAPDYFAGAARYGCGLRPRSPYLGSYEQERYGGYGHELELNEMIRRLVAPISKQSLPPV